MRFGLYVPPFGHLSGPAVLASLASRAERAGWDGFYLWDHVLHREVMPIADPWVALSAMACATTTLRLGPLVTPLARRRPWVVARQAATLDHLSVGRLVLGIGLGGDGWREFSAFGEPAVPRIQAEILDEALAIVDGLWKGVPFSYAGGHFQVEDVTMLPRPVQEPRVPIWAAVIWPHRTPLRRAARCDGVFPIAGRGELSAADITEIRVVVAEHAHAAPSGAPYDVVVRGRVGPVWSGADRDRLAELEAAGVTWWLEAIDHHEPLDAVEALIGAGPPDS